MLNPLETLKSLNGEPDTAKLVLRITWALPNGIEH